ncbi:hypothetical protein EPN28_01925 [Patescibacteria group bacterium]|nr:MAG: hypothetical protein EPN28_01925 [Patescibacteria group bacterium]
MKKISATILAVILLATTLAGSFLFPRTAQAAWPAIITKDIPDLAKQIKDKIIKGTQVAVMSAAMQATSYFMRKIAYDTAVYLAAGGKGQSGLAFKDGWGSYMKNVGGNAFGKAIEELGKPLGLNLCKIPDIKIDLAFRIGLKFQYGEPAKPACDFNSFVKNWGGEAWKSRYGGLAEGNFDQVFNASLKVEETDLGLYMDSRAKIDNIIMEEKNEALLKRQEGQGMKGVESLISGAIKTPAQATKKTMENLTPSEQQKMSQQMAGQAIGSGTFQIIPSTISMFLNTLAGEMVKNFLSKGMFPFGIGYDEGGGGGAGPSAENFIAVGGQSDRRQAETMYSELLTPKTTVQERYNILAELSSCPESPAQNNCAADEGLVGAAQEASGGKPLTIAEALQRGAGGPGLHGDWKLIPPDNSLDTDRACYQQAYCYSNIKKLRKARVLPLGFEIAALNSNPDKPWTLKQVVDGFNDCNKNSSGVIDNDPVNKPFCRLIDPNWVLKAPASRCNALASGPNLLMADGPERMEECVDLSACVAYDKDGNCATYGYCSREKNVWRFDAGQCKPQNRTCLAFTNKTTGAQTAYLQRTLDTGYCEKDNVGCSAYSLKKSAETPAASSTWLAQNTDDLTIGENSAIYFNKNLSSGSSGCSANSAGCAIFKTVSTTEKLSLKKAPYYLKCYDANPGTPPTDWPETVADLTNIKPEKDCVNYAQVCLPSEVGCDWYSPQSYLGDRVPGQFTAATITEGEITWNDQCDAKCVGYASYREMPSNYSAGQDLAYIIPASGASCPSAATGCASFTNLSTTTAGLTEQVEFFSYLRPCVLPEKDKGKVFFTYEGSTYGGFQLKTYTLVEDAVAAGAPKYWYKTQAELTGYDAKCSEALYKAGTADADCRQFNDDKGAVYYRLLAKTIPVDKSCAPYRLNEPEFYNGANCFQNGEYKDGACFYYGLPGSAYNTAGISLSCQAQHNSCREYKGNAGNNTRNVFYEEFEAGVQAAALTGWAGGNSSIAISAESTRPGGHSLGFSVLNSGGGTAGTAVKDVALKTGKSYDLTFWAKSSGALTLAVALGKTASFALGAVSVSDVWRYYHLGPVEVNETDAASLTFSFANVGSVFLDNISLKEVTDYIYLVKKTLKVDQICDSDPTDNLPGEALGCSAYANSRNTPFYLTGFSNLCRENAIGCTALYDTYNTPEDSGPRAYNVWLSGAEGTKVKIVIPAQAGIQASQEFSCQVPVGEKGCYVNVFGYELADIKTAGGTVTASTVFIPPDTRADKPIYLVADKSAHCNEIDVGCTYAGKKKSTPSGDAYETVLVKNDPDGYDKNLCQSEAEGCDEYNSPDGTVYFKDPVVIGQKICSYRADVTLPGGAGNKASGWFWKGVGQCDGNSKTNLEKYCVSDSDCAKGITLTPTDPTPKCVDKDLSPCYPDYLKAGNLYDLWSYGDKGRYKNFVGECPAQQSGCTEYVDHNDSDKAYYIINDEKLKSAAKECVGQVSEKAGCVLFDKTDWPNKLYDTAATYADSAAKNYALVQPIDVSKKGGVNNANTVLKVVRDRECGEWLQCKSSHRVWSEKESKFKEVCDGIGRCAQAPEKAAEGDITNCKKWVDFDHEYTGQVLSDNIYRGRDTSWKGLDYSGFSLLGLYPPEELDQRNLGDSKNPDWRLVKMIPCGGLNCKDPAKPNDYNCAQGANNKPCGKNSAGICKNNLCMQSPSGPDSNIMDQAPNHTCRAYPEKESPYPNTANLVKSQAFVNANKCNESGAIETTDTKTASACECDYTKVNYGDSTVKYWGYTNPNKGNAVPQGYCLGGSYDTKPCATDDDCAGQTSGTCEIKKKENRFIGWRGFCLEKDMSRPINSEQTNFQCLSWLPVQTLNGALDVDNQFDEAGYKPAAYGRYYCAREAGNRGDYSAYPTFFGRFCSKEKIQRCATIYKSVVGQIVAFYSNDLTINSTVNPKIGESLYNQVPGSDQQPRQYFTNSDDAHYFCDPSECYGVSLLPLMPSPFSRTLVPQGIVYSLKAETIIKPGSVSSKMVGYTPFAKADDPQEFNFPGHKDPNPASWKYGSLFNRVTFSQVADYDIHLYDIDQVEIEADMFINIGGDNNVVRGTYIIRNGAKSDITKRVRTLYGKNYIDQAGKSGCVVAEENADGSLKGDAYNSTELCDTEKEHSLIFEKPINTRPPLAETRIKQFNDYTIMRFFSDNRDAGAGVLQRDYIKDQSGFFPEYGDSLKDSVMQVTAKDAGDLCDNGKEDRQQSLEVVLVFDKDKKLIKVGVAKCLAGGGPGWWPNEEQSGQSYFPINIKVTARLREYCDQIADVADRQSTAWTNRIWEGSKYSVSFSGSGSDYIFKTLTEPFGSLNINNPPSLEKEDLRLLYGPRQQNAIQSIVGAPYGAKSSTGAGGYVNRTISGNPDGTLDFTKPAPAGLPAGINSVSRLDSLFAKVNNLFALDNLGIYKRYNSDAYEVKGINRTETLSNFLKAPKVLSVNCQGGICTEGPAGITLNDKTSADVKIPVSPSRVTLKFYGYADMNQMPIRNVKIDWNDGSAPVVLDGYFRNHRGKVDGKCESVPNPLNQDVKENRCTIVTDAYVQPEDKHEIRRPMTKTCQTVGSDTDCKNIDQCLPENIAPNFGQIVDKTCDNAYFRADYSYQCVKDSANFVPASQCPSDLAFKEGCCKYTPKVQVKDNWGWCNGSCPGGKDGGCYQGFWNGGKDECTDDTGAFTSFSKSIIVAPK